MTVRVRYTGTELCPEGVVEVIHEANGYDTYLDEEGGVSLNLLEIWDDEESGKRKKRVAGTVAAGRWQSVVTMDDEVVE